MLKITRTKFRRPFIALSVSDRDKIQDIKKYPVDLIEVRLDSFSRLEEQYVISKISGLKKIKRPLVLTIRSKAEGGLRFISDELRLGWFDRLAKFVDAVDIELNSKIVNSVIGAARANDKTVILSAHFLQHTPSCAQLKEFLCKAKKLKPDIIKIAAKANSIDDVFRLGQFTLANRKNNIITISLGMAGAVSRILFPLCGSLLAYSFLGKSKGSGQFQMKEFLGDLYRYGVVNREIKH